MNNPKTISRPDRFHYWKEKGEGERRRRIIGWKLTFHQRSRRWSGLLRYAGVTMSRRGERKQCHGIKEQYATRILSHPLLSIYTYIYPCTSWQKGRFFRRALIIGHTESFHDTSSLSSQSRILFYESRYIYIYIFLGLFFLLYSPRHTRTHRFNSMWYRYASRVDRWWKTSSKNNEEERIFVLGVLLAIIRNTRDGLKTGELEFQWCLERYAISNAKQRIVNYVSNLHLEYR